MALTWKTVRVFISSTFRDTHAERDHLIKVVFPELQERLEKHRIHLVDIDLRWGVTAEQANDDKTLDVFLPHISKLPWDEGKAALRLFVSYLDQCDVSSTLQQGGQAWLNKFLSAIRPKTGNAPKKFAGSWMSEESIVG
jgi:hypothetical protein